MIFNRTLKTIRGTTLLESVISVLILAVGLVALAKLQANLSESNVLSKQRSEASLIAQDKLEELKSFGTLETTSGYSAYADITSGSDTVNGVNANFSRTWTVTENTSPDYKTVNIVVTWTGASKVSESISLSTIISKIDPLSIATTN